jgi:hypothetical protein
MPLDGKDLMAVAKAALASAVAVLDEFHIDRAAERERTCEEMSCTAYDLQHAAKLLQELAAAMPKNSVKFASAALDSQKILAEGEYRGVVATTPPLWRIGIRSRARLVLPAVQKRPPESPRR